MQLSDCTHPCVDLKEDNEGTTYVVCEDCGEEIETADDNWPY